MSESHEYERVIAIGDLNGALGVLREILLGTEVMDHTGAWIGGRTHVIQTGDIFDRDGGHACACLRLLVELDERARAHGGRVTHILGNHEVMAATGDERWITVDEYLAFATAAERDQWRTSLRDTEDDIATRHPNLPREVVQALIESWKRSSAPGRPALERALAADGEVGLALRRAPVATIARDAVFCHGGLAPEWAARGLDGLAAEAAKGWQDPNERGNLFHAERGPLWHRQLILGDPARAADELGRALDMLGVARMVVGHTPTSHARGGRPGRIATLYDDRLVCIDVGLAQGEPGIALLMDEFGGREWTPESERVLWRTRPSRP